jgi:hypothetical protein
MSKPAPPQPLETRHVFLDTQVYRRLHHNVANPALATLARHIADRVVVLHITDITLLEIRRQIAEDVAAKVRDLATVEKSFRRWRHTSDGLPEPAAVDPAVISADLFRHFAKTIVEDWAATVHRAQELPASKIFADYFARNPPFDQDGSKEFPDAFMLKALEQWCAENGALIHVLTQDAAMSRAADRSEPLRHITTLEELLSRASVQPDVDLEAVADAVVAAPGFNGALELLVEGLGDELIFDYRGDLPEAEIVGHSTGAIEAVTDYTVAWVGTKSVCMILTVETEIVVEVQYEDRSLAMYDREDDSWFGGETASTELFAKVPLELFIEVELQNFRVIASELLRTEYTVSEGYGWPDYDEGVMR